MSYRPIEDYGIIGDCHGCALIARDASVDWLVLGRFDGPPTVWGLLDDDVGGHLGLELPIGMCWRYREYEEGTNILVTTAESAESKLIVTDFMPVGRSEESGTHDYTRLESFQSFIRKIEARERMVRVIITAEMAIWPREGKVTTFYTGTGQLSRQKERAFYVDIYPGEAFFVVASFKGLENFETKNLETLLSVTRSFWKEWIEYVQYKGPHQRIILRSALVLKLLTFGPTGAIIAAATTSLPESIGGERNWDYRYSWLRDSSFTLYALAYLGYSGEADRYGDYMKRVASSSAGERLKILYRIDGGSCNPEFILPELKGYEKSSPVRVGNGAYDQFQLDTYGEFLDWALLHKNLGGVLDGELLSKIGETAEFVRRNWRLKDQGIWEVRSEEEDFTFSKVMCWVALDRAERIFERRGFYAIEMNEIESFINDNCIANGILKRSAQSAELDASLLLIKTVGYPLSDEIHRNTTLAIQEKLGNGIFVKRYLCQDGLRGDEGYFLICSFWLVNALFLAGEIDKGRELFLRLLECPNDLGLLSEEIDPESGRFLGNFPQALTHLGLLETASYLELYEKGGRGALEGSHSDRVGRLHKTLHGPRAVVDFLLSTRNLKKLIPSSKSIARSFD